MNMKINPDVPAIRKEKSSKQKSKLMLSDIISSSIITVYCIFLCLRRPKMVVCYLVFAGLSG